MEPVTLPAPEVSEAQPHATVAAALERPRSVRCVCLQCGSHVIATATAATLGGNCGNCGSYEITPLDT